MPEISNDSQDLMTQTEIISCGTVLLSFFIYNLVAESVLCSLCILSSYAWVNNFAKVKSPQNWKFKHCFCQLVSLMGANCSRHAFTMDYFKGKTCHGEFLSGIRKSFYTGCFRTERNNLYPVRNRVQLRLFLQTQYMLYMQVYPGHPHDTLSL